MHVPGAPRANQLEAVAAAKSSPFDLFAAILARRGFHNSQLFRSGPWSHMVRLHTLRELAGHAIAVHGHHHLSPRPAARLHNSQLFPVRVYMLNELAREPNQLTTDRTLQHTLSPRGHLLNYPTLSRGSASGPRARTATRRAAGLAGASRADPAGTASGTASTSSSGHVAYQFSPGC